MGLGRVEFAVKMYLFRFYPGNPYTKASKNVKNAVKAHITFEPLHQL
jgi:hypothetical protein